MLELLSDQRPNETDERKRVCTTRMKVKVNNA
jgi:hypothetical protein